MSSLTAVVTAGPDPNVDNGVLCAASLSDEVDELVLVYSDEMAALEVRDAFDGLTELHIGDYSLSRARNIGFNIATSNNIAFVDDDVIVDAGWGNAVREGLSMHGAVCGPAFPLYELNDVQFPERWHWLIGCGPYHNGMREVRNGYGCNMAFRREELRAIGGFNEDLGMDDDLMQGEDTDAFIRVGGALYHPGMQVKHWVTREELSLSRLFRRAWMQGRTKAELGVGSDETSFLREAIDPSEGLEGVAFSLSLLAAVGGGYLRGQI